MCMMEVHARQRRDTMAQAMAHNTKTVISDLEMLIKLLEARKDTEDVPEFEHAMDHLRHAYAGLLGLFGEAVARLEEDPEGHVHHGEHPHNEGTERSFVEEIDRAARTARVYETR